MLDNYVINRYYLFYQWLDCLDQETLYIKTILSTSNKDIKRH